MKIIVHQGRHRLRLSLPNWLLINAKGPWSVVGNWKRSGFPFVRKHTEGTYDLVLRAGLTRKTARRLRKMIRVYRRKHPSWCLVDAHSSDGGELQITL